VRNYRNLSITGTAQLRFSNPHNNGTIVILRVADTLTITSTASPAIDLEGIGSNVGNRGLVLSLFEALNHGANGQGPSGNVGGSGGSAIRSLGLPSITRNHWAILKNFPLLLSILPVFAGSAGGNGGNGGAPNAGAGGGGGGSYMWSGGNGGNTSGDTANTGNFAGGSGGRGGGGLVIIAKKINFTGTISVRGQNGQNGTNGTGGSPRPGGGGGGGGAGGSCYIFYNNAISLSGTILYSGGNGGNGGSGIDRFNNVVSGGAGGAGGTDSNGSNGANGIAFSGGGGGGGASGYYLIAQIL
jgi:hypothetical protein